MAKAASNKGSASVTVVALVPVEYDGVRYEANESVEVRADDLPQLVEVGAVQAPEGAAAPSAE